MRKTEEHIALMATNRDHVTRLTHHFGNAGMAMLLGKADYGRYLREADAALLAGDEDKAKEILNDGYRAVRSLLVKEE